MNYSQKPDWFLLYRLACLCHCRIFSYSLFIIHRQQDKFNLLLPYLQDNPLYILIIVVRLSRLLHTPKNPALPVIRFHACEKGGDYLKFNVQRITSCLLLQPVQQQVLRSVHGRVSKIHKKDRSCGRTQQMRDRRRARRRYLHAFRDE